MLQEENPRDRRAMETPAAVPVLTTSRKTDQDGEACGSVAGTAARTLVERFDIESYSDFSAK